MKDEHHMQMALELAARGRGFTSPNPLVGAVVVNNGVVVGQGFHQFAGGPHAEVRAIDAAGGAACGATLYVNLEPCNHIGRTPPCTLKILEASIDIADVDVGENVGAKLQAEQAEANKLIAQAQAEVRRAAAVATEQEMIARVSEMRARVVEAEAQIPIVISRAFEQGHLGIMDYYRIRNVQADTSMRENIASEGTEPPASGATGKKA